MICEIVLAAVISIVSIIWMYLGIFEYGIWTPGVKANGGFVPTIFAALTLIFSIVMIVNAIKAYKGQKNGVSKEAKVEETEEEKKDNRKAMLFAKALPFVPVFITLVGIYVFEYFGVVIFTFLLTMFWLKFVSNKNWKTTLVIAFATTLFIYLIFELWLKIPFPGKIIRI